ncbi:transformer-2 protein homolog beta isoform X2 [Ambystoma mexicanum]|uniref:transformer-2 protein homolog beta isoform X2 n=1 Tax=Ambystoma mexicanum TaxID=8296 RepID=UPI0037E8FB8B
MSDSGEPAYCERGSRSASRSASARRSGKSASHSPARSRSKDRSRSKSRSRSDSRSRSRRSSRRHYTRSRTRSRSHRRSRSRSYSSREYRRRRSSHSHSPMSSRRRHTGSRTQRTSKSASRGDKRSGDSSVDRVRSLNGMANPDPNCCLGVFGLSLYTTERDLREVFSKYGPLADVSIVYDQQSRRSRGFSFVYFENVEDAKEAKERANGMELDGRRIRVDFSITKRPHTPTPGIYMGRPTYGSNRRRDYYDRGYERGGGYDDREYYSSRSSYRGGGGGWRGGQDRDQYSRRRSPSPYYSRGGYRSRSRSRSYSPRRY